MLKTISIRGKKEIVAVFNEYAQISGKQDTSRPKAVSEFITYVSEMPLTEGTKSILKQASKKRIQSDISDDSIPSFMKIPVEIEETVWEKAMEVFIYAFSLKVNPQMPYFLRVAGTAYIIDLQEQGQEQGNSLVVHTILDKKRLSLEEFKTLNIDDKLNEIFKLVVKGE